MSLIDSSFQFNKPYNPSVIIPSTIEFSAEVVDIILDDKHPDFEKLGGWSIIGMIKYRPLEDNSPKNLSTFSYALPLNPSSRSYPFEGELITIVTGLPTSNTYGKESFSVNYYKNPVNIKNTSDNNSYDSNNKFVGSTTHSNVLPKRGDVLYEGRFQNSLKFSSDENGNPITIIRNGRQETSTNKFSTEDVNNDSSLIVFSSKQKVNIEKQAKFSTYSLSTSNSEYSKNIKFSPNNNQTVKESQSSTPLIDDVYTREDDLVDFPVNEGSLNQSEEVLLDKVDVQNPSVYLYDDYEQTNQVNQPVVNRVPPIRISNYTQYIGKVEKDLSIPVRAMLDTIAWAEGMIGQGQFNGYDVGSGYVKIPNWSINYQLGCPQIKITFFNKRTKKVSFSLSKGYWGRYQYGIDTWKQVNGKNISFSKRNQDLTCAKHLSQILGSTIYNNIHSYMTDINGVFKLTEKLSKTWASIPFGKTERSYYTLTKDGVTSFQPSRTNKTFQDFYLKTYNYYGGR